MFQHIFVSFRFSEDGVLNRVDIETGSRSLLDKLEDVRVDVPKAPEQIADIFASLVYAGMCSLTKLIRDIRVADMEPPAEGEDTMMVDSGTAKDLLGALLRDLKGVGGSEQIALSVKETELKILDYFPSYEREKPESLTSFLEKYDLKDVL